MKIALVHDYLKEYGGAERVLQALHEVWPQAPIYTLFSCVGKKNGLLSEKFKDAKIIESWFGKIPFCEKLISPLRFLIPLIWGSFNFEQYDLVISSASWAIAKGFAAGRTKEVCYCHTPPRYLYGYETSRNWQKHWYIRPYAAIVNHFMRLYDYERAQKVTWFVANSREVQSRIKKFYRRDSTVINPPVDTPEVVRQLADSEVSNYFLTGGRLEAAKNFNLIIKSCNKLKVSLKIYGTGSQIENLRSIARLPARQAGPTMEFLGVVDEKKRQELMAGCQAFIVAATDEDFGITPVEAMACGRPVIAFRGGGYLESVVEGKTGEFFDEPTVESLVTKLQSFKVAKYKSEDCYQQAKKFSKDVFKSQIAALIKKTTESKAERG